MYTQHINSSYGNSTYGKILDETHSAVMHKGVVPVPVPVLEEDAVQLVVHAGVGGAEADDHLDGRVRMDVEAMQVPGRDDGLRVLGSDLAVPARIVDNTHDALLHGVVLGLEHVDVQRRPGGLPASVDQVLQVGRDGPLQLMPVSLAEHEGSPRRRLQELGDQQAAETNASK